MLKVEVLAVADSVRADQAKIYIKYFRMFECLKTGHSINMFPPGKDKDEKQKKKRRNGYAETDSAHDNFA